MRAMVYCAQKTEFVKTLRFGKIMIGDICEDFMISVFEQKQCWRFEPRVFFSRKGVGDFHQDLGQHKLEPNFRLEI